MTEETNQIEPEVINQVEPEMANSATANHQGTEDPPATLSVIDLIYGTLFRPVTTFRIVGLNPPVFKSFLILVVITFLNLLISIFLAPHSFANSEVPAIMGEALQGALPFMAIIGATFSFISWVVLAGLLHLFAEFFDGKGSALGMLSILGLIQLPKLVAIPFQVFGTIVGHPVASTFMAVLGSLLYLVWWSIIIVIGIREGYSVSTGKAIAIILLPVLLAGFAMMIVFIAGAGIMIPMLDTLMQS